MIRPASSLGRASRRLGHIPPKYGGLCLRTLDGCLISENIAYGCTVVLSAFEANGLGSMPIMLAGNEEQKYFGQLIEELVLCA